jgi:hypothetical protein
LRVDNQVLKTMAVIVIVLFFVLAQASFIYALQHGAAEGFTGLWAGFAVSQTGYSHFVFNTIKWWWSLPAVCLLLLLLAVARPTRLRSVLALVVSLAGVVALYWSAYAPALFIDV